MLLTVYVLSCLVQYLFFFSIVTNLNVFSLSQEVKDIGALGIQVYWKS